MKWQAQVTTDRFLRSPVSREFKLNVYERMLVVILSSYCGSKKECYPSHSTLAVDCGMSIDCVKKYIRSIERKALFIIERNDGYPNRYRYNIPETDIPGVETTRCSQLPGADTTTHPVLTALGGSAVSTTNNINNNIREYTSVKSEVTNVTSISINHDVQDVFDYWKQQTGHSKAKLDSFRMKKIRGALKDYSVEECKLAIDGCVGSEWHKGNNENGKAYDSIGLIFRNAEKIEGFMATAKPAVNNKLRILAPDY